MNSVDQPAPYAGIYTSNMKNMYFARYEKLREHYFQTLTTGHFSYRDNYYSTFVNIPNGIYIRIWRESKWLYYDATDTTADRKYS